MSVKNLPGLVGCNCKILTARVRYGAIQGTGFVIQSGFDLIVICFSLHKDRLVKIWKELDQV